MQSLHSTGHLQHPIQELVIRLITLISIAKDSMGSKGMPEFSLKLCSKTWVPVMAQVVRQAKLSDNTLEKHLYYLLGMQFPRP